MIEPPDLEAPSSGEYELDAPAGAPSMPASPTPLPRIWKTEDSDPELKTRPEKKRAGETPAASPPRRESQSKTPRRPIGPEGSPTKREAKKPSSAPASTEKSDEPEKKKVLVEETPEWDTYETRRRARLFLGVGMVSVVFLAGLIGYKTFLSSSDSVDPNADSGPIQAQNATVAPVIDVEAMAMLDRAKDHEKAGRRQEAIALLDEVTKLKAYSKTPAARLAKAALDRADLGQPMFPDGAPEPVAMPNIPGAPPTGVEVPTIPADPARGVTAAQPPADFNLTRPPDPARGLAMFTPAKPELPAVPKPALSVDPAKAEPIVAPSKPKMNPLPRGFHAIVDEGAHESGWPLVIEGDKDEGVMVFVPEGKFVMGANGGPVAESPAHRVRLRAFYIDQHEVTIGQFNRFLDAGYRRLLPRNWTPTDGKNSTAPSMPVVMVNYKDAQAYAEWTNRQLPTEAQWEMAARSSVSNLFPWGSDPITWDKPRAFRQVDPVKSFSQDVSPFGVFDLAGNVSEWTQDWFDLKYFSLFKDTVAIDPTGPAKATRSVQRVVKGGAKDWSVSYREGVSPEKRSGTLGFRCVLNINSAAPAPAAEPADLGRPNLAPVIPF